MGRPSMYSRNYYKIMRRRRRMFRLFILLTALTIIFFAYNKSVVPNLKKLAESIKLPVKNHVEQRQEGNSPAPDSTPQDSGKDVKSGDVPVKQEEPAKEKQGEHVVKLGGSDTVTILFEQKDSDIKFTGIKSDIEGISYNIREDGKSIVFDNSRTSDIWVCNLDGVPKKLNPDNYKEYEKASVMQEYNNYVWAAKPVFLKDGRIVYQSNLPWFKTVNSYYLWVVDSDGKNNKYLFGTNQGEPAKYSGFTDSGALIVEYGGAKYSVNIDERAAQKID